MIEQLCQIMLFYKPKEDLKAIFNKIDLDSSGQLSLSELHTWWINTYAKTADTSERNKYRELLKMGIDKIDKNHNGKVDMNEFRQLNV